MTVETTILLRLRDAAKFERSAARRDMIRAKADELQYAILAFKEHPAATQLQIVNGLWASCTRLLKVGVAPEPNPNGTGLRDGAELQKVA